MGMPRARSLLLDTVLAQITQFGILAICLAFILLLLHG